MDFVKIDVEGFETEVILGAARLFERLQPKVIVLEEHALVTPYKLPPALSRPRTRVTRQRLHV